MNKQKKLNLNKYSYLDYLKGDVFAWLTCNENYVFAAKKDKSLKEMTPWRWETYGEKNKVDKFDLPAPMVAGIVSGDWTRYWAKYTYPRHQIIDMDEKGKNINKVELTKELLSSSKDMVIFEAAFQYNNFNIRTDIIIKTGNKIKVLEAKAITSPHKVHANDVFFQKTLINKHIEGSLEWDFKLLIINSEYLNNTKLSKIEKGGLLFIESPIFLTIKSKPNPKGAKWTLREQLVSTGFIKGKINEDFKPTKSFNTLEAYFNEPDQQFVSDKFDHILNSIKEIQLKDEIPNVKLEKRMWEEGMKSDYMPWILKLSGLPEKNSIFDIKGSSANFKKKFSLYEEGIYTIKETPISMITPKSISESITTADEQNTTKYIEQLKKSPLLELKGWKSVIQKHYFDSDELFINKKGFIKELNKYNDGPIYMYDFETADLSIPMIEGGWPYQQVPYQYSIHIITNPNDFDFKTMKNIIHIEWLAKDINTFSQEFWKELAQVFIKYGRGTYVSWNMSFEKTRIKEMDITLLTEEEEIILEEVHDETIDLRDSFSKSYYYHKDMKGSSSIKSVGPHFVKEINYENLIDIQKGDESSANAKKWLLTKDNEDWEKSRFNMLKYCEYDTLLMVGILQKMKEMNIK